MPKFLLQLIWLHDKRHVLKFLHFTVCKIWKFKSIKVPVICIMYHSRLCFIITGTIAKFLFFLSVLKIWKFKNIKVSVMRITYNLKFGFFFRNLVSTIKRWKITKVGRSLQKRSFCSRRRRLIFLHKRLLAARNKGLKAYCDVFAN